MLSKRNRVSKKDVDLIFKEGKFVSSANLNFKFVLKNDLLSPRISFIAPKSITKASVKRNLLRRRGYIALKKHINQFPASLIGVFIFKKYQDDVLMLENEIKNFLAKIN